MQILPYKAFSKKRIRLEEGCSGYPYTDSKGYSTIGIGHNLNASPLDQRVIDLQYDIDYDKAVTQAQTLTVWPVSNGPRKAALIELVFWMGLRTVKTFRKTLAAWEKQDWAEAAAEIMDSQTGRDQNLRGRLREIANMVRTGQYV